MSAPVHGGAGVHECEDLTAGVAPVSWASEASPMPLRGQVRRGGDRVRQQPWNHPGRAREGSLQA